MRTYMYMYDDDRGEEIVSLFASKFDIKRILIGGRRTIYIYDVISHQIKSNIIVFNGTLLCKIRRKNA